MKSRRPKITTFWHVIKGNRLFVVRDEAAHQSFKDLREKTHTHHFRRLSKQEVSDMTRTMPFRDTITLDY